MLLQGFLRVCLVVLALPLHNGACSSGSEPAAGAAGLPGEPTKVSFKSPLNLIILEVNIAGQGPFRFFLDSGATSTIIDTGLTQKLGLETGSFATRRGTAAGSQVTAAPIPGGVDFTLAPGFEIHVDRVISAPFTHTAQVMMGERFDGILGSTVFFSYVVEVDYAARTLSFHDPESYRYSGPGAELELDFPQRIPKLPFVKASLVNGDRRLSDFPILVDSGGMTMGAASVAKRSEWDSLLLPSNRVVPAMGATGLSDEPEGTTHEAFITQMDRFMLGPFEFENPQVSYSAGGPGIAVMGASLLHRFTAVFDYSRKRLILEPNARFDEPHGTDRSGAMLVMSDSGDGTYRVLFVASGTPADEAGLARGDIIESIDGFPASEIPLNQARAMFCRSKSYKLLVLRDGIARETILRTRPLFG